MKVWTKISLGICIAVGFFSCGPDDNEFSSTPELFYRSFTDGDSIAVWSLGFTDGDGDIGVRNDNDPDNFIVTAYYIIDGVPTAFPTPFTYRIPVVQNVVTKNGIEGEFKFQIEKSLFLAVGIDSLYLSGYVIDRSEKQSNFVDSPVFSAN